MSWLALVALTLAAPPSPSPGPPRLTAGDEFHFAGEVVEAGGVAGLRFRKSHDLEVRAVVLDAQPGGADCALLTRLHPRLDEAVAGPVGAAGGGGLERPPAAVRVEYVRVDYRGRVYRLSPPAGTPLPSGPGVPATPYPPLPLDGVPLSEVGVFAPVAPGEGPNWTVAEEGRPDAAWAGVGEAVWNGGRAYELRRLQQSPDFDRPAKALTAWRRVDAVVVSPADGVAGSLKRRVEHRHGGDTTAWTELTLERQPAARPTGKRMADARAEAELAIALTREFDALARASAPPADYAARLARVERAARDAPPGGFRAGVESAARRFAAAAKGDLPRVPPAGPEPRRLGLGRPAPDFRATPVGGGGPVALSECRGAPVALVFYRPGAKTAPAALAVARALAAQFAGRVRVLPLAIYDAPQPADGRVYDGAAAQAAFGVVDYPRFCLIDAEGVLAWEAFGVGPETGFLLAGRIVTATKDRGAAGTRLAPRPGDRLDR